MTCIIDRPLFRRVKSRTRFLKRRRADPNVPPQNLEAEKLHVFARSHLALVPIHREAQGLFEKGRYALHHPPGGPFRPKQNHEVSRPGNLTPRRSQNCSQEMSVDEGLVHRFANSHGLGGFLQLRPVLEPSRYGGGPGDR